MAIPGAVIATVVAVGLSEPLGSALSHSSLPALHWTTPAFDLASVVGIAIPLFVVTMAAQNVPGMAVLRAFGYEADFRSLLVTTGGATVLVAPFGGLSVNLAAITAALCAAPEAHPDPKRRWLAAAIAGATYALLGLAAGAAAVLASLAPILLLETVAGLAVLRALGAALAALSSVPRGREAAVVTFVVTVSQISVAGIGSPFWGLVVGASLTFLDSRRQLGECRVRRPQGGHAMATDPTLSAAAEHYNFDRYFRPLNGPVRKAFRGSRLRVGDEAPEFEVASVDGTVISLAAMRNSGPVALVFGCWSAPPAVEEMASLEALSRGVAGEASIVFIYTREIHPDEDLFDEFPPVPAHRSLGEKTALARRLREELAPSLTVGVDDLEGTTHLAFGGLPVFQVVVDRTGEIVHLADWASADLLRMVLENLSFRFHQQQRGTPRIAYSETLWCTAGLSRH
jgi:hypothetical protein